MSNVEGLGYRRWAKKHGRSVHEVGHSWRRGYSSLVGRAENTQGSSYRSWKGMRQRCTNPNDKNYKYYGGRGIRVCARWFYSYDNFLEDMGEKPAGASIDRIDNNGNYSPENCRWATWSEQMRNRRGWRLNGKEGK